MGQFCGRAGGRGGQVINEEAWKWSISRPVKRLSYLVIGFSEVLGICMDFQRDIEFARICAVLFSEQVLSNWPALANQG